MIKMALWRELTHKYVTDSREGGRGKGEEGHKIVPT